MVITPFRLFLFVVAAFLAAGGTAYYTGALDAYFAPAPRQVAKQDAQGRAGSAAPDTDDTSKPAAEAAKAETASAGNGQAKSADAEAGGGKQTGQVVVPAFDIVRVEPDGSMVVAGHAAPESNVEVVSGSTIVGKAQSGPMGDFAVVLDEPLKPGNHQIVLRSTTPKDVVATSKETAVVSVPDTRNGEVLALVEAPGKPSRLITKPKAKEDGTKQQAAAASQGAADKAGAQASGEKAEQAQPHVAMAEPPASAGKDAGTAGSSAVDAGAMKAGSAEPASQAEQPADNKAGTAGSASAGKAETSTPNDTAAAAGETAPAKPAAGNSVASADAAGKEKIPAGEKKDVKVFIEAVEIDGKDVFVAGGGVPGQRVRVYANDILLGDAVVSPNGRFLVQTTRELPVGDYIVRADLLSDNGAEVIARAAVPFEREPGEKLAAVAPSSRASGEEQQPAGDKEPAGAAGAATEEGSGAATTAPQVASKVPDSGNAEAGSASDTAKAAVSAEAPETNSANEAGANVAAASGTSEADAATDTAAKAADSSGAAQAAASEADDNAAAPAGTTETGSGAGERMAAADAKGGMELPDLHNGVAENAPVITAPKLESVDGAVIIRRGDTLWQISRRVYGRGMRYSTIYLANQEQIRNPDMIWPGQVFSVPQETKDGESADMKAIGEQAVPADMAGTEPEWRR